jgi:hypothetical protein
MSASRTKVSGFYERRGCRLLTDYAPAIRAQVGHRGRSDASATTGIR